LIIYFIWKKGTTNNKRTKEKLSALIWLVIISYMVVIYILPHISGYQFGAL
jgi:nicotinamide riboside transporter PnuC